MEFPAFLKLQYQDDGTAKARFLQAVDGTLKAAETRFAEFSSEAQRMVDSALSVKRNNFGSLDLGVDEMRAAAQAQQARAIAAQEVARATALAAKEQGDYSAKARLAVAATEALAKEEQDAAVAALAHVEALEQVQMQLNKTASGTTAVVQSMRRGTSQFGVVTNSIRAQRVAFVQLGQQMTDVAIQAQMGARWPTIFVQQVPQMAFALSGLEGKIGSLARTLSGPLGAAMFGIIALAGPMVAKMIMGSDAADEGKNAIERLANRLDLAKNSYRSLIDVVNEYKGTQSDANIVTYEAAKAAEDAAKKILKQAEAELARVRAMNPKAYGEVSGASLGIPGVAATGEDLQRANITRLEQQIAQLNKDLANSGIITGTENVKRQTDQRYAIEVGYNEKLLQLDEQRKAQLIDQVGYEQQRLSLIKQQKAAIEAYDQAHRKTAGSGAAAEASLGDMVALTKQLFPGARITSTNTGKHVAGSDHYKDHAIDFVPAGGMGQYSKSEVRSILEGAGVDIRRNAGGVEQLFGPGDKGHSDHFHFAWQGAAPDPEKVREAFAKAQQVLDEYGQHAGETIQRINERFDEQPKLVDQAAAATRQLDDVIAGLQDKKPPNFEEMIASAEQAKATIQDALVRPFNDMLRDAERRKEVDDLILQGHDAEAAALQEIWRLQDQIGTLTEEQKANVEAITAAEQKHAEAIEKAKEVQSAFLDATRSVRSEIESILAGEGKLSDFKTIFKQLNAKYLTEKIFGDTLRDLDKWVKENTGIKDSVDYFNDETTRAGDAAQTFASVVTDAATRISTGGIGGGLDTSNATAFAGLFGASGATPGTAAANDNGEIVVTGKKLEHGVAGMTPDRYFEVMSARVVGPIVDELGFLGPKLANALGGVLSGALYGYATGGTPGGILGGVKGLVDSLGGSGGAISKALGGALKGSQTGTLVAGLGNALGIKMSGTGAQIGGAIGSVLPIPGGEIIGAIAGGIIGKLLGGHKTGRVTLGGSGYSVGGTSTKVQGVASQAGDSFLDSIASIASQLGGTVGNYGTITLGQRDGHWRVNVGGSGSGSLKTSHGAKDFGDDQAAAVAYALQQAIVHGAVQGISRGAQQLLKSGKDLDAQLQKALDFDSVFKTLKELKDPVGAALDDLNEKFDHLKDVFKEAGATTAEYAQLEELYGIERAKAIKEAADQISGSLRDLYADLTTGDMGLSLRDRKAAAQTTYDGLAARVRAGDTTAYDDYADAARNLLDIERQLYGSQSQYFDLFNEVKGLTKSVLDHQDALVSAATNSDSPFASSGSAANDNQGVIDGLSSLGDHIVDNLGPKLDAFNANLGTLIALSGASGAGEAGVFDLIRRGGKW